MTVDDKSLIKRAEISQRSAVDPTSSVWVSASAGTGKTKVLTDRVLSLLVTGSEPQKLICLTFTKAAAAEMEDRIAEQLGKWVIMEDRGLETELNNLLGNKPNSDQIQRARQLFALVLDTPGGMHIETIHAFCQSLLRRFPLEAKIAPHFTLMDDRDADELLLQAREEILARAHTGGDRMLSSAIAKITLHLHETSFPGLLASLTSARGRLRRLIDRYGGVAETIQHIRNLLGIKADEAPETILSDVLTSNTYDEKGLQLAVNILSKGSKTDIERAQKIKLWLTLDQKSLDAFEDYIDGFLTTSRHTGPIEIRKTLITKNLAKSNPFVEKTLAEEAIRLKRTLTLLRSVTIAETTEALVYFSGALLVSYQMQKERRSLIDYDDLIIEAGRLLNREDIAPWILFKLDGGIDHLLIDEAQDTSPEQWRVVEALVNEFVSGQGAREKERTIFVVGDIKQSIYSFQGADPEEFQAMRSLFSKKIPAAGHRWREINLTVSFRSTPAVLETVDAVFRSTEAQDGVMLDGNVIEHQSSRTGEGGLVELWPPVKPRERDTPIAWKPPVERIQGDSPPARLAHIIAERIRCMIDDRENLVSQGRPIRAGDIMILVRRRGIIVEELVRALKILNIGVAGVDRMVLTEQISVMDLIALGHFLLLPQDDLTLATVLKCPFIGFDEDALFELAHNRSYSLWQTLTIQRSNNEAFQQAFEFLSSMLNQADNVTPFELYSNLLDAKEGRKKILSRLGPDAADAISEFLNLALAYEQKHVPSLEGFLYWLETSEVEIKRDLEQARPDAVRIMTVHGAKGLQAPIVFLPDTMQVPSHLPPLYWPQDEKGRDIALVWPPRRGLFDDVAEEERKKAVRNRDREYRRLLYVAMTRAQDRLYICGWHSKKAAAQGCWYKLIEKAISEIGDKLNDALFAKMQETTDNQIIRVTSPQTSISIKKGYEEEYPAIELEPWALSSPPKEPVTPRPLTPSQPYILEPVVHSPLRDDNSLRFKRGNIIHTLLQRLPELDDTLRRKAAKTYLKLATHKLTAEMQNEILEETLTILNHPEFYNIFGLSSRAEVPLVGEINGQVISAQIDRLVIEKNRIIIVDYKTNREPPSDPSQVPEIYLLQMSAYKVALEQIYPRHKIECLLLWTDGPILMRLQPAILAAHSP